MTRYPVVPRFIPEPNRFGGEGYTVLGLAGKIVDWPIVGTAASGTVLLQVYVLGMPGNHTAPEAERLPLEECAPLLEPIKPIPLAVARLLTSPSASTQQQGVTMLATASGYTLLTP